MLRYLLFVLFLVTSFTVLSVFTYLFFKDMRISPSRGFDGSLFKILQEESMTCIAFVMYVTCITLAGASVCTLCQAGSYGSVSGEWIRTDMSWCRETALFLHCRSSRFSSVRSDIVWLNAAVIVLCL